MGSHRLKPRQSGFRLPFFQTDSPSRQANLAMANCRAGPSSDKYRIMSVAMGREYSIAWMAPRPPQPTYGNLNDCLFCSWQPCFDSDICHLCREMQSQEERSPREGERAFITTGSVCWRALLRVPRHCVHFPRWGERECSVSVDSLHFDMTDK